MATALGHQGGWHPSLGKLSFLDPAIPKDTSPAKEGLLFAQRGPLPIPDSPLPTGAPPTPGGGASRFKRWRVRSGKEEALGGGRGQEGLRSSVTPSFAHRFGGKPQPSSVTSPTSRDDRRGSPGCNRAVAPLVKSQTRDTWGCHRFSAYAAMGLLRFFACPRPPACLPRLSNHGLPHGLQQGVGFLPIPHGSPIPTEGFSIPGGGGGGHSPAIPLSGTPGV